jgi:cytochrome P450
MGTALSELTGEALFGPENKRNPHPLYHRLRTEAPHWIEPEMGEMILTRWADCEAVLRDPRWSSDPAHSVMEGDMRGAIGDAGVRTLLFMDPPDHTRLRRLVSKAFTPRKVEQLRGHVGEIFDDLMSGWTGEEPFEVMSGLAYQLPVIVICELLGVPVDDRHQMEGWSSDASRLLDFSQIDEATAMKGMLAAMQFINYFNGLFDARRAEPRDDLLSELVKVEEEGDTLTEEELRSIVLLLFVAGHETTMNLIGNGLLALLRHPEQLARLRDSPSLVAGATEEILRWGTVTMHFRRTALADTELAGTRIRRGDKVLLWFISGDYDERQFPDPFRFDIRRAPNEHLAFGLKSPHKCIGEHLARVEIRVLLQELLPRLGDVRLDGPVERLRSNFISGIKHLPIRASWV